MPVKNDDLHGDLEFPEGENLLRFALPMAKAIAALNEWLTGP